ncbi:phage tail sheath protein [Tanticharoenia sakaeratensis]|uniref:Phage tail sheath protein n=1 Tax=Tanticharoenia sakaeratensis NBRC 103193 TaxID=1231623 RepID=A0A0D6MPF7_9PROT|nr:tail protein [Tanticharoenia sakaeratensis]GAN55255.1 phage tail sheath protein [Tanticharoenia sakaeratensis NBRC 103193]GBQ23369.1 phage tail sheath protein [Tanticharoenia sakaeratensis NBRC 103193]
MATIYQSGALNTTALVVPGMYVQIVAPSTLNINGVSTSRIGFVGTAGWGPVNKPVVIGGMNDYLSAYGPKQALTSDLGLAVNVAYLQGAADFRCVRVTDGTDTAATLTANGITFTGIYTGTQGNAISVQFAPAASGAGGTLTVGHALLGTKAYTGVSWAAIQAAVAADAAALIVMSIGSSPTYAAIAATSLAGGTDGGTPSTTAFLGSAGSSTGSGTGMYALASQSCAFGVLCGLTDSTSWSTQAAFGLSNGIYMVTSGPSGDTISNGTTTFASSGATSYALKCMFGDWLWWNDDTNGLMLIPPSLHAVGVMAGLGPQQSSLNKQLYGVVGSQKSGLASTGASLTYSSAELEALIDGDLDVICYPAPGGSYWACRAGINTSGTAVESDDSYTRLTNYFAESFATSLGTYIGATINATLFSDVRSTFLAFLSSCLSQGILGTTDGSTPYAVVCDVSNNPVSRTSLGYLQVDVQIQYQGIVKKFIVNLQGGSSVTVTTSASS